MAQSEAITVNTIINSTNEKQPSFLVRIVDVGSLQTICGNSVRQVMNLQKLRNGETWKGFW